LIDCKGVIELIRPLSHVIARRAVVAHPQVPTRGAREGRAGGAEGHATTHLGRRCPHHLRVVATNLAGGAGVSGVVVVSNLVGPIGDHS